MKIVLFDQINEVHVCTSLHAALAQMGHAVMSTGPVWRGHRFPASTEECEAIDNRLDDVLAMRPDALLNFRASSLLPRHLDRLRRAGVKTLVWFPDDPVLYGLCYSAVVDHYDVPLHCASGKVLNFYRYRKHRIGVNLPFWVDTDAIPYVYEAQACDKDLVFFGNMHGPAKQKRYELFCSVHDDLSIYGKVPDDPHGKAKGVLHGMEDASATLRSFRIGLNTAQCFQDYRGTPYDFPGMAMLGSFFLPSRVLQYAAIGLPVLTLPSDDSSVHHYPAGFHAGSAAQARDMIPRLLAHANYLQAVSRSARRDVEQYYSASSRARFLSELIKGSIEPRQLTPHEQEFSYRYF